MATPSDRIYRSKDEPIREGLSWEQLWLGPDQGLIWCWERGRQKRTDEPDLAARAERGELPLLAWKGGVEKRRQEGKPIAGTWEYLAVWQGLRGEDLHIDRKQKVTLICSATGQVVEFFQPTGSRSPKRHR
jgi:hypothetical protein